jgi:proteasome alpha subunit
LAGSDRISPLSRISFSVYQQTPCCAGFGNTRYPYYYGPEGRLVLVDSALEAVHRGSTTIGIKTPVFALISSHIKPTKSLVEPAEKIFTIDGLMSGYIRDILQLICHL